MPSQNAGYFSALEYYHLKANLAPWRAQVIKVLLPANSCFYELPVAHFRSIYAHFFKGLGMRIRSLSRLLVVLSALGLLVAGCGGGGGGGGGFNGAARVSVQASPDTIDAGDRTLIKTTVSEVHPDGISLKFAYPAGFDFVFESASLKTGNDESEVTPVFNGVKNDEVFLVFFFSPQSFGDSEQGELTFELEANDDGSSGSIMVDADVDDSQVDNSTEFSIEEPQFQSESEASIRIRDR
jgi:hypothetical protein